MRSIILIVDLAVLLTASVLCFAMAPPAEEKPATTAPKATLTQTPEQIRLEAGDKKPVMVFHRLHQEALEDCNLCHNLFPQVGGSIKKLKAEGKLEKQQVMKQCRRCHKNRATHGEKTGPIRCDGCHRG